jgi:arginyl-tRNA synthetase
LVATAIAKAQEEGRLPTVGQPEVGIEYPPSQAYGDYACSLPLKLARAAKSNPLDIAENIAQFIHPSIEIEKVAVAPPGFINFTLRDQWLQQQVNEIIASQEDYGKIDLGYGRQVQLEFVSVNPTGPLHVGHGRGAVLGSTLANILSTAGYKVIKEYYLNDAGSQMDAFYRSLFCRYRQARGLEAEMPADGYYGNYIIELAQEIINTEGDKFLSLPPEEAITGLGKIGLEKVMDSIKNDLKLLGVEFDVWFSEQSLYQEGQFQRVMSLLKEGGYIAQREGATWLVSSALGEDKDNVLVRSNNTPTYFATDIAYHYNKFVERQFDQVIDIWGADHQGHISRMKVVMSALGVDPGRLEIIITQMVALRRGGEELRISKRSGDIITLHELIEEVGADACRFFFLSRSPQSQLDFDLELAKKASADNPVYYIQYAYARIAGILRLAQERGIDYQPGDVSLLNNKAELNLIRKLIQLPEVIELAAESLEPHHLTYYAQELATRFHDFYEKCRVVSDDEALTQARLKLVEATRVALAKTLRLMGMTAPERM